jgi:protoporphyrinogen oxidase
VTSTSGQVVVIGAGPCGLGAALGLASQLPSSHWQLVEAEPTPGGLASSFVDQAGFTWDYGGHVTFDLSGAAFGLVRETLGDDGWNRHERRAWAVVGGDWIRYPVQHHWPGSTSSSSTSSPAQGSTTGTLESWAAARFNPDLLERFFRPYNEKLWRTPLTGLGAQWLENRVPIPSPSGGGSWGPNASFWYPKAGGCGAPWRRLGALLHDRGGNVHFGCRVVALDLGRRVLQLSDGSEAEFSALISTMPLDRLIRLAGAPSNMRELSRRLLRTKVKVFGVGLKGTPPEDLPEFTWLYFAGTNVPFYRVSRLSAYASSNTPSALHWSLLVECSMSVDDDLSVDVGAVVAGLQRVGLLGRSEAPVSVWSAALDYGYPIPTPDRDEVVHALLQWLARSDCHSVGRFGDWQYETSGQDQAFAKGLAASARVAGADLPGVVEAAREQLSVGGP